ncbi:MAG: NUDIX domain-containing protein [Paracoccaceae bacterium]|nr:NUDIX domain-containing protein [Paracoccaceae bacterium]
MTDSQPAKDAIRNAATVVLLRHDGPDQAPRVLMGQRGKGAAFMPSKFVFPGGALDAEDAQIPTARPLNADSLERLRKRARPELAEALAIAAIRELWEETGLALAVPDGPSPEMVPEDWHAFFEAGHRPAAGALEFIFRAITPPGRPRRFDARFFLADAERIAGDLDDFSRAGTELSYLSWLTLPEARALDLPFITGVVLAEVEARLAEPSRPARPAPFFHHAGGQSFIDPL